MIDCVVAPLLHNQDEPAEAFNTTEPPAQNVVGPPAAIVAVGNAYTLITFDWVTVPQLLVTLYIIVTRPLLTPLTTPLPFTEAIKLLLVLHVPLPVASDIVIVLPTHTDAGPVTAATTGAVGCVLITTLPDATEVHPAALVTVNV